MSSGVGGLPANSSPATWPSGHHFKERFHATALIMRGFLDGGRGRSHGSRHRRVARYWIEARRGSESKGAGKGESERWTDWCCRLWRLARGGCEVVDQVAHAPERRARGERAASQICKQADRQIAGQASRRSFMQAHRPPTESSNGRNGRV